MGRIVIHHPGEKKNFTFEEQSRLFHQVTENQIINP